MTGIKVQITRFVDAGQPGFVECQFTDAHNKTWSIIEKLPIVTSADLWSDSIYPQPGVIGCDVVKRFKDAAGEIIAVNTEEPYGIETLDGVAQFEVRPDLLIED